MYIILDTQQNTLVTTFTTVQFDFLEEPTVIAHTNVTSDEDIQLGISNREVSERNKLGI